MYDDQYKLVVLDMIFEEGMRFFSHYAAAYYYRSQQMEICVGLTSSRPQDRPPGTTFGSVAAARQHLSD